MTSPGTVRDAEVRTAIRLSAHSRHDRPSVSEQNGGIIEGSTTIIWREQKYFHAVSLPVPISTRPVSACATACVALTSA
jgi:hypothetical protein